MTLATTLLAAALVMPSMPPPEYDDCEVVTNCVFDASRDGAKVFSVQIELDVTQSNGVEVVFGRDVDGDGILSRTEETMSIGYGSGEWKVVNLVSGDKFSSAGTSGRTAFLFGSEKTRSGGGALGDRALPSVGADHRAARTGNGKRRAQHMAVACLPIFSQRKLSL